MVTGQMFSLPVILSFSKEKLMTIALLLADELVVQVPHVEV